MLTDVVVDPETFFAEREPELRGPLAVIGLTTGLGSITNVLGILAASNAAGDAAVVTSLSFWSAVTPVLWLAFVAAYYLVAFHGLAVLLDGDGEVADTLAVVGWGFVPKLFAVVATLSLELLQSVGVGREFVAGVATEPALIGLRWLLVVVMLVVSAVIWYHGVRTAHGLDPEAATFVVGLPVIVAFLFDAIAFLGTLALQL